MASITQRFLFPVSTVSDRNARHNDPLLCPRYEDKRVSDYESIMSLAAYASETTEIIEPKMIIFNSLIAANDYNCIVTERPSRSLADQHKSISLAVAGIFLQKGF